MTRKAGFKTLLYAIFAVMLLTPYPIKAAEQGFFVKKLELTGNTVLKPKEIMPVLERYQGKKLTFSELQKAAEEVASIYHKRGYILAKVYIPEQKMTEGVVELAALEGKIGSIKLDGEHKYYSDEFIKRHFYPILQEGALNQDTLERALLVLNEYPKLKVTANLQAGKEPGTADILVKAENSIPVTLTLDYNNFGSKYVSRDRYGAALDVGNVITEGALFSVRGVIGNDIEDMKYGRVSYTIPVNIRGTKLGAYYAKGNFDVGKEFEVLSIKGSVEAYGLFLSHPIIKKRQHKLDLEIGFDGKNSEQTLLSETFSYDKIRSVRGGLICESTDTTGRTFASFFITQGLGESFGAMENDSPLSSRKETNADNMFTKYNLELIRIQKLFSSVFLFMKGSGQWASNGLVSSERFSIGGADSVRGFPQSEYLGDEGYAVTAELRISPLQNKEALQFALFIDNGGVAEKHPPGANGEKRGKNITGGGGGVRIKFPYDINLKADVGFPIDPDRSSGENKPILYVQIVKKF